MTGMMMSEEGKQTDDWDDDVRKGETLMTGMMMMSQEGKPTDDWDDDVRRGETLMTGMMMSQERKH